MLKIDTRNLDQNSEVSVFDHYSNIPLFHVADKIRLSPNDVLFQYIVKFPKCKERLMRLCFFIG